MENRIFGRHFHFRRENLKKIKNKTMIVAVREFMTIGSGEMSPLLWIPMYIAPVVWFLSDQAVFDVFVQNLKGNFFFIFGLRSHRSIV